MVTRHSNTDSFFGCFLNRNDSSESEKWSVAAVESMKYFPCPNGRKKSHCMLARRSACSQLRLGDAIGRNVHTTRFQRGKCS